MRRCDLWGPWLVGEHPPRCQRHPEHGGLHEWRGWVALAQVSVRWTRGSTTEPLRVQVVTPEEVRPRVVDPW